MVVALHSVIDCTCDITVIIKLAYEVALSWSAYHSSACLRNIIPQHSSRRSVTPWGCGKKQEITENRNFWAYYAYVIIMFGTITTKVIL